MDRDERIAWVFAAVVICFLAGVLVGTWIERSRPPAVVHLTYRQYRHLCAREQHHVVSTWRRWTEKAAAAGECRAYVLAGDEP